MGPARAYLPLTLVALVLYCASLKAEERVGNALRIDRTVSAAQSGATRNLETGGGIERTDVLQSDASGRARIQFVDETIVTMGGLSTLRVEQITLRPNRRATEFFLETAKGAFRFATGKSAHDVYRIDTPMATLGVRGTQFNFEVTVTQTLVAVTAGAVQVCPRNAGPEACVIIRAGRSTKADALHASVIRGLSRIALTAPPLASPTPKAKPTRGRVRRTRVDGPDDDLGPDYADVPQRGFNPAALVPLLGVVPLIPGIGGSRGGGMIRGGRGLLNR